MKRPSTLFSAVLGAVTSLPVMAIAYLGQTVLNLPFPPFDIFDWIARVLPGGLVTFGIDSMVAVIRGLRLGQISDLAKTGERMMAIAYEKAKVSAGQVLDIVQTQGFAIVDVSTHEADLEDVFVQLTSEREAA